MQITTLMAESEEELKGLFNINSIQIFSEIEV